MSSEEQNLHHPGAETLNAGQDPMTPMTPMPVSTPVGSEIEYGFGYSSSIYQSEDSHREHRVHKNVLEKTTTIAEPSDDDDWGDA